MRTSVVQKISLLGFFIVAMGAFIFINERSRQEHIEKVHAEFIGLKLNSILAGRVLQIIRPDFGSMNNEHPSVRFVMLNDSTKWRIRTGYELNTGVYLADVISVNDSLFKKINTDTLIIVKAKNQNRSIFLLEDDLGYPLRK